MSAFTVVAVISADTSRGRAKRVILQVTGTASYDTGGSIIDLSQANAVLGSEFGMSTKVSAALIAARLTAADDKYNFTYIQVAPSTGLLKVRDLTAASCAEVTAATSLAASTFELEVVGY